ncbi:sensor histidine kinase [Actinoplanes aureus]|uniref:Sensor histidine kinase n=1 Tax=Actinoplanes aureus TaxID=2792083 RepID=A0A931G1X9_9ACTN|nr:histidine kinase [Actinoplanes aureus]MBG0568423.1 sensor histidine kinase [Actinoplanes aureus]
MAIVQHLLVSGRRSTAAAIVAAIVTLVAIGQLRDPGQATMQWVGLNAGIALSCTAMGMLILAGIPTHRVGRLLVAAGICATTAVLAVSWTGWPPLAWLAQWCWCLSFSLVIFALLFFPDGRLGSPWRRALAVVITVTTAVIAVSWAIAALDPRRTYLLDAVPPATARAQTFLVIAAAATAALLLETVVVAGSLWLRWRRSSGQTRHQVACVLLAGALLPMTIILDVLNLPGAWILVSMLIPAAMTLAILQFGLYGLDRVINRTIVWLIMAFLVIVAFVALVAVSRVLLFGSATSASLAATGVIAVTFQPVLDRVQRGVNQLLYGDRDDPYRVVTRLGGLLGRTVEPQSVPPLLAETIARSLRVPYVAVETFGRHGPQILAQYGTPAPETESFDMISHSELIGRLLVATRSPASRFALRERRVLSDVAQHAAIAVEATLLIHDLRESRERLVVAREEERRRLRRDLHDGLGPTIAGMSMQVRAAQQAIVGQPRAAGILDRVARDLQICMAEVRRLVDQLRPPALDGGLAAALRAECRRFTGADLTVNLDVRTDLDGLPAAFEVAAYRIIAEALTNVSRHARATTCDVTVSKGQAFDLTVVDDGVGFTPAGQRGVGLTSMRERTEELGGSCLIAAHEPHGTCVRVRLPLRLDIGRPTESAAQPQEVSS